MNQKLENIKGIQLNNISKSYGKTLAVDSISLHVKQGEFMSLLGPSGCGKTTTLRIIAGLTKATKGTIYVGGLDITNLPPNKRSIGLIFQDYAIWPHMTVFENLAFGLKLRKFKLKEIKQKVEEILSMVNLFNKENRYARELSGGEQQRVAIARALVLKPDMLLLDEPLSNLDRKLRIHMRLELSSLQKKLGITSLYVTHDQEEALSMSDRVAIMNYGKIIQVGTPNQIYENPQSSFTAKFIGNINIIEGTILKSSTIQDTIRTNEGCILELPKNKGLKVGDKINIIIRPEKVKISRELIKGNNILLGEIKSVDYLGSLIKYFVDLEIGYQIVAENQNTAMKFKFNIGEKVYIGIDGSQCYSMKSEV